MCLNNSHLSTHQSIVNTLIICQHISHVPLHLSSVNTPAIYVNISTVSNLTHVTCAKNWPFPITATINSSTLASFMSWNLMISHLPSWHLMISHLQSWHLKISHLPSWHLKIGHLPSWHLMIGHLPHTRTGLWYLSLHHMKSLDY